MTTRVPIRYGGTGANTAASARTALGVPPLAAYDVANSASSTANAAYGAANSAYSQANNAYAAANTANTNALNAYSQANAAYGQANLAYSQANSAYAEANLKLNLTGGTINGNLIVTGTANASALNVTNVINANRISLSNTGTAVDASQGNILTNQVTGTQFNFLSGLYTAIVTGGGSVATNYTLRLPPNVGLSGQVFTTDGTGNTSWTDGGVGNAYNQANAAYNQANTAYGQANLAYGQANLAYAQANAAYNQANLAYTAANNSNLLSGGLISGTLNVTQDVIVGGNLYLSGNTTFINVSTYQVNDPLIFLAANNTLTDSVDIGFIGGKNTSGTFSHTGLARDATDAKYKLFDNLPDNAHQNNIINFANSTIATLVANLEANSILLSGNAVATNVQVNAAFFQANTAYAQANAAYSQANSARDQANTAYGQANSAYAQANLAYAQANSNYLPAVTRLNVTAPGLYYSIDQYSGNNPTLYIRAGETLAFNLSVAGHPFMIRVSSGGANYNTGLTHVATNGVVNTDANAQGQVSGTLYWKVPFDLQGNTYVYQCSVHSGMVGNIVIEQPTANVLSVATSAYGQANAAYGQANAAYGQANTGYAQANAAYGQANTAYAQANAAYGQANTAYTAANNAANTVRVSQNSASTLSAKQLNFVNTANVTITVTDSGDGNANVAIFSAAGGGGGGSALTIKDDGTTLNTAVTSIDFVGSGVTATANGSNVTVTIPTGLSNTIVKTTSFTATNAAANLTYTLPVAPVNSAYLFVIKNGIVLTPNTDYSVSNTTLTVKESGAANDVIEVRYFDQINIYESANTLIEVTSNTVAAQTNTFTLANVTAINRIAITKNGLQLTPNLHYSINTSSNTVTLNTVAEIGDILTFTNFRNVNDIAGGAGLVQYTYNTSTSSIETVDQWSKSTYRSAKYQMQVESGSGYQSVDIMVLHDGVDTNVIQYGSTTFGSNVGVFTSDISGSNVRLRFTATDATSYLTYFRTILANRASESLPTDLMSGSDSYDLMITLPFNPTDLN